MSIDKHPSREGTIKAGENLKICDFIYVKNGRAYKAARMRVTECNDAGKASGQPPASCAGESGFDSHPRYHD